MDKLIDILAYCIPALVVLACAYVVMQKLLENDEQKRLWEARRANRKEVTPARLRAYERLSLLLERTQPEHMLMELTSTNVNLATYSIAELQQHLLRTLRQEFDHNLSQQIYVSDQVWDQILSARDQTAAFINAMAAQMKEGSTSLDYAKTLMTAFEQNGVTPHQLALTALKEEVKEIF